MRSSFRESNENFVKEQAIEYLITEKGENASHLKQMSAQDVFTHFYEIAKPMFLDYQTAKGLNDEEGIRSTAQQLLDLPYQIGNIVTKAKNIGWLTDDLFLATSETKSIWREKIDIRLQSLREEVERTNGYIRRITDKGRLDDIQIVQLNQLSEQRKTLQRCMNELEVVIQMVEGNPPEKLVMRA